ncbi:MAG: hypothetical protein BWY31_00614 [Lentisphaerae bacterium ADurb.Bin242]|nr:MAG: hypothetical protein BWY31_00614 [Lentisphaerae bacterium ADurb.Bin242]
MKIQFGVGRRCINPQVPISLAGYFNIRMWDKVLDDLEVRAIIFKQGPDYAAILQFDLVTVPLFLCDQILDSVRKAGIRELSRENILICATHTHTGPEVRLGRNGANSEYLPFAAERAVEALREALGSLREGELEYGRTADHRFIFNRRYWMKNGNVLTNPGKLNAAILRPEGEIDPEIPLLGIRCDGKLAVLVCSIVNHTDTIGGNGVSADWPGFLRRSIEADLGEGSMLIPLIGASGNINHFDVSTDMPQTQYTEARRIGTGYAETIREAIPALRPVKGDSFRTVFGEADAPPREISEEEIAEAKAVMEKYPDEDINGGADMTSEDLARGAPVVLKYFASVLLNQADYHETQRFFLTGFSFGSSVVIASLPSEPFTEIGLALRKEIFRERVCLVAALANGTGSYHCGGGYIPNAWNYGRGGYETTPRSNPFSMKTSAILLKKWRELSEKI